MLSNEEMSAQTLELLRTNGGCRLPCWWGFTPDVTDLQRLVSHFHGATAMGTAYVQTDASAVLVNVTWRPPLGGQPDSPILALTVRFCVSDAASDDCYGKNPFYAEPMYPSPPYILATYGLPTQAYISYDIGLHAMGLGSDLYFLFLDYSERGWILMYQMEIDSEQPMLRACLNSAQVQLTLWSPDHAAMARELSMPDDTGLKTVEAATGLSLQEFYDYYANASNQPCLESPRDLYQQ